MGKKAFSCVKWLLTLFNFIFLICGLATCGMGIWMLVSPSISSTYLGENLTTIVAYIVLCCGGTIILISFCGCAGAGLENRCLLCLFFTVLCGIFVACLVASILVTIFRADLTKLAKDNLSENLKKHYGSNQAWTEFWNLLQNKFSCCGVEDNSSTSLLQFQKTKWYKNNQQIKLPESCCAKSVGLPINLELCQKGYANSIHKKGCLSTIIDMLKENYLIILCCLISLAVVLIFGMCLSLAHLRNIINIRYYDYSQPI